MTRNDFVECVRGRDTRDKDPAMRRVTQRASLMDVLCATLYFISWLCMLASLTVVIVGVCTQRWQLLWACGGIAIALLGIWGTPSLLGPAKYEYLPIEIDVLNKCEGEYIFIHWLNDITGYADDWVPYYGATEEFVRFHHNKPELCIAPLDQYGRGWIAYTRKLTKEELLDARRHIKRK